MRHFWNAFFSIALFALIGYLDLRNFSRHHPAPGMGASGIVLVPCFYAFVGLIMSSVCSFFLRRKSPLIFWSAILSMVFVTWLVLKLD